MAASIVVAPSQWAVRVDRDGIFSLKDVPAGSYTVVAWHKTAGTFRKTVIIGEKDTAVSFTLPYTESSDASHVAHR